VDVELLEMVADAFPNASLVLVGPVEIGLGKLPRLSNVHVMGPQPADRVPAYIRGFDVGLNPRPMGRAGQASDPIKVFEYLAAGIPVVSTRMRGQLDEFYDLVWQADRGPQFCQFVRAALTKDNGFDPGRARELARCHRWLHRCEKMLELVA
jgi:glycosyltransferase involved in cell wall biosynthesis